MSKATTSGESKNTLYCSFCGKSQHEVRKPAAHARIRCELGHDLRLLPAAARRAELEEIVREQLADGNSTRADRGVEQAPLEGLDLCGGEGALGAELRVREGRHAAP